MMGADTMKCNEGIYTFVYFSTQGSKVGVSHRNVIVGLSSVEGDENDLSAVDANTKPGQSLGV